MGALTNHALTLIPDGGSHPGAMSGRPNGLIHPLMIHTFDLVGHGGPLNWSEIAVPK